MRTVGIKGLTSRLGEYVRLAASGETILIEDGDQLVAEMGPRRATEVPCVTDPGLADMVRRGELTPARARLEGPAPSGPPVMTLAELLAELDEDRADRW